jgi:hypothetical protein
MLYALFTGDRGLFICDRYGDMLSAHRFEATVDLGESPETVCLAIRLSTAMLILS